MSEQTKVTPVGTLAFDKHLFEADEKGKFRAALVLDKEVSIKDLEEICMMAAREKWPNGLPSNVRMPIKKENRSEMIEKYPFMENRLVLNASTKFEVQVYDKLLNQIFKGDVKSGDLCRFSVSAWAYAANGNVGVALNLLGVQKIAEGEALFSRVTARQIFSGSEIPEQFANNKTEEDDFEGFSFS